jgi:hypothetical protein
VDILCQCVCCLAYAAVLQLTDAVTTTCSHQVWRTCTAQPLLQQAVASSRCHASLHATLGPECCEMSQAATSGCAEPRLLQTHASCEGSPPVNDISAIHEAAWRCYWLVGQRHVLHQCLSMLQQVGGVQQRRGCHPSLPRRTTWPCRQAWPLAAEASCPATTTSDPS